MAHSILHVLVQTPYVVI